MSRLMRALNRSTGALCLPTFMEGSLNLGKWSPLVLSLAFTGLTATSVRAADKPAPISASVPPQVASAVQTPPSKSFVAVGERPAVLYDAPSTKSNKNYIVQNFTPLEVLVKLDKMTKVRDSDNTIGWIENSSLSDKRFVQVSVGFADVRSAATATSPSVFDAQRAVVLEVTGPPTDGWLPVKHRDGQSGFVRLSHVWGD